VGRDATLLIGLTLLVASCGCPDFRSNSLGVCTHILAILLQLAARPRVFRTALASGLPEPSAPRLGWDPIKPLYGDGDWLARIPRAARGRPQARAGVNVMPEPGADAPGLRSGARERSGQYAGLEVEHHEIAVERRADQPLRAG